MDPITTMIVGGGIALIGICVLIGGRILSERRSSTMADGIMECGYMVATIAACLYFCATGIVVFIVGATAYGATE